ncbi:T9SS type A sorting domain-containing protein [Lacihabitans sp. LS3-19]|uniref:T9SS type A sorting domain-containing protein n=1 Tax=Lacihabitans sp. LS3-19 TaxID=2487335 RepID=UPI0020CCFAC6|nr:T9SS type A sorting domain-containing protein [Lacihabitans sp. LS3-19]
MTVNQNNMRTLTFVIGSQTFCYNTGSFGAITYGPCVTAGGNVGNIVGTSLNLSASFAMPCSNSTVFTTSATTQAGACTPTGAGATGLTSALTYPTDPKAKFPVKITNFESKASKNSIDLKWNSIEEINFDKFIIQKSLDAKSFEDVGDIKSKGAGEYSFVDSYPKSGPNYYRLKMLDLDGTVEFSKIISAIYFTETVSKLFPNPVENNQIIIHEKIDLDKIKLTDIIGRKIEYQSKISDNETIISPVQNFKGKELIITFYSSENILTTQKVIIK